MSDKQELIVDEKLVSEIALLADEPNIRAAIAVPKNQTGRMSWRMRRLK